MKVFKNITELIGNTPLVELSKYKKVNGLNSNILAKVEYLNPGGSVKDRVGLQMIESAEEEGIINKDTVIIEPTSGNTGVGLALACAIKEYKIIITMPESMSVERRKMLKAYGAELVLTPAATGMSGAIEKAEQLNKDIKNSFIPQQFKNKANVLAHEKTTGKEILRDTDGKVDMFVAGVGTGGTITGVAKVLKENNPNVKIIAVEPLDSPVLSDGKSGAHKIQGIGAGFVPEILDIKLIDKVIKVSNEDAYNETRQLVKTEGILAGISSGAALYAAKVLAKEENNKNIVVLLPDTGQRYFSTDLFEV